MMQRYHGHPIYVSAMPAVGENKWHPKGLVFAPTETESPIVKIKRLQGPRESTFATKEEAEQYAVELCIVWIDEHPNQTLAK